MEHSESHWRTIYQFGAIFTFFALCFIILDMVLGMMTGGDLTAVPHTAVDRYYQLRDHRLLGLYNLDLLNLIIQLLMIPSFFALYAAHRKVKKGGALLSLCIFLIGTAVFLTSNTALTMLELSKSYFTTTSEVQKSLLAAAGEAMLAKGAHGSLGVFVGFALIPIANLLMSMVMFRSHVFNSLTASLGIAGNLLMLVYILLITLVPATGSWALALAIPGGLLTMGWMGLYMMKLVKLI